MPVKLEFKANMKPVQRALQDMVQKQMPYAISEGLNNIASGVQDAIQHEMRKTFDDPTDFTMNAITVKPANKSRLKAVVYPREVASHYLEPYVFGGNRSLWAKKTNADKKAMLVPRGVKLNGNGNLPAGTLARLKARSDVFIGPVTFKKSGRTVSGVWQRVPAAGGSRPPRQRAIKGKGKGGAQAPPKPVRGGTTLKLLIQFEDSTPVPRRLPFFETANAYFKAHAQRDMAAAIIKALRTARR